MKPTSEKPNKFNMLTIAIGMSPWVTPVGASPEILTPEQWAADVDEMVETILDNHPRPYLHVERDEFDAAVQGA